MYNQYIEEKFFILKVHNMQIATFLNALLSLIATLTWENKENITRIYTRGKKND